MIRLVMCNASNDKENEGTELLYSPLALAYLARHTPDYYDIRMYDEYVGRSLDPFTIDADLVAVSALTSGITSAYEIGDALKKRGIPCVIGGAHASALPYEALEHFDSVIIGEGETPWKEFLQDFEKGEIKSTYFGPMNVSLENLGTPRRDLIHPNYHYPSVLTSRGCPYHCSFCYLTVYKYRKYRTIPHETVLEDMESLRGNFAIVITDENFMGYKQEDVEDRKELLRKMIDRDFGFYWGCQTTVSLAEDPELMDLMYRAGCRAVFVGFEATDQETLKAINKRHNMGIDYQEAIRKIHKHKIAVIASTILGLDHHKPDYHKQVIKDLKHIKADFPRVFFMTAFPGTALHKKMKKEGRVTDNWSQMRQDTPSVVFKYYTHEDIIKARQKIMRAFFNPVNITKVVMRWIFRDPSLLGVFAKMIIRNTVSEKIRNKRARKFTSSNTIKPEQPEKSYSKVTS